MKNCCTMSLVDTCNVTVNASFLVTFYSPICAAMPCSGTCHAKILPLQILPLYFISLSSGKSKTRQKSMQHAWKIYQTNDYNTFSLLFGSLQTLSTIELRNEQKILILHPRRKGPFWTLGTGERLN